MNTKEENIRLIRLELAAMEKAVSLVDSVIAIAPKFDGKVASKRLDAALRAVDRDLCFSTSFNSFKISLFISDRSTQDRHGNHSLYIQNSEISLVHACIESGYGDGICQTGTINAALLIAELTRFKTETEASIKKTTAELGNIDALLTAYADAQAAVRKLEDSTTYLTRRYLMGAR